MDDTLRSIFYNPEHPAGFASINKLAKASGYSRKKVKEWLQSQAAYTLHRSARKKYPTRQYIVHDLDEQWQADLADMSNVARQNGGHNFILTVIDVFSRYAWARPLKNKSGKTVAAAFKSIFTKKRIPKRLQTDQGTEFKNPHVNKLYRKYKIEHFSPKSAYKAAIVERFNRTLKRKMYATFSWQLNNKWLATLPKIVSSYNNSIHRTIGCKPIDVTPAKVTDIRERIYDKRRKPSQEKVDIKVGDHVRISKVKGIFEKGYLPNWTEEIFTVDSINRKYYPVTFKLRDYQKEMVEGSFYRQEIQKIEHESDTFIVEKVLKTQRRRGEPWCWVKWQGYPSTMNSWVRKADVQKLKRRESV